MDTFSRPAQQSGVNLQISALLLPPFPDTVLFFRKALVWFSFCLPATNYFFFLPFFSSVTSDRNPASTSGNNKQLVLLFLVKRHGPSPEQFDSTV